MIFQRICFQIYEIKKACSLIKNSLIYITFKEIIADLYYI